MRKVFFTFGCIVLVAVAAAWYFITYRLDGVVETQIEKAATLALGTHVEVGGVKTDLRNGTLSVAKITVANPPGFENPYAVQLNSVQAAVDYDELEIKRVVVENPEFVIEEAGGQTNFGEMLKMLEASPGAGAEEGADEGAGEERKPEPVIVIRHFRINETRAAFDSRSLDRFTDVKVDAIEMNNLRGTPSELAEQIGRKVVGELSSEAAAALLKAEAKKKLGDVGGKIGSTLQGLLGGDEDETDDESEESGESQ